MDARAGSSWHKIAGVATPRALQWKTLAQGGQAGHLRSPGRIWNQDVRPEGRGGEMGLQLSGYRLGSDTLTQLYEDICRFVIILQTILTISWWGEAGLSTIVTTIVTTIITTIIWRKKTTLTSIIC